MNNIYREHIDNLPILKTQITDNPNNDLIRMIEKTPLIDYILKKGTVVFDKVYAERLAHLALIEKLIIPNQINWMSKYKSNYHLFIDCLELWREGFWQKLPAKSTTLLRFCSIIHRAIRYYEKDTTKTEIYLMNLLDVISQYYVYNKTNDRFFQVKTACKQLRENYFIQVLNAFIDSLGSHPNEKNNITIVIENRCNKYFEGKVHVLNKKTAKYADDYKETVKMFLDCFNKYNNSGDVSVSSPFIELWSDTSYFLNYRSYQNIKLLDGNFDKQVASLVLLDMNKLFDYTNNKDLEVLLKDLYIDAQALNQIKRYILSENNSKYNKSSLTVRLINVPLNKKYIVEKVLQEETARLKSAYTDNFRYEIECKRA